MNIVIAGIGKFGKELTEHLSKENHNIIIIDSKPNVIEDMVNQYDIMGYCGNAASLTTQTNASVAKADIFIATTSSDEVNILCCLVAKKLGVKRTIARIINPEYSLQTETMREELGISMALNPDLSTAKEIFRILRFPSALTVESFANGKVDIASFKIENDSVLNNISLLDLRDKFNINILVCAVKRENDVFIPKGNFILNEGDTVYVISSTRDLAAAFKKLKLLKNKLKSTLIIGGGKKTHYLASLLIDHGISVKIIEKNKDVCKSLSASLPDALIIHGEGTNHNLLMEEGIDEVDSIVTLTGMDETNIIISSFANTLKCEKVITKVNNTNLDIILNSVGLDSVISPKSIFCSSVLRFVRGANNKRGNEIKALHRLVNNKVEALEFFISKSRKYTSIPLKRLAIKPNYLVACIVRENKVIIPSGNDTLEPLDSVIIVTTDTAVDDIKDILE